MKVKIGKVKNNILLSEVFLKGKTIWQRYLFRTQSKKPLKVILAYVVRSYKILAKIHKKSDYSKFFVK